MDSRVAGQLEMRFAQAHEVLGRRWHRRVELLGRAHGPVADDRQSAHDGVPDTGLVEVAQGGANSFIAVARGRSRPGSSRRLRRAGPADRAARPQSTHSPRRRRSPPSALRVPARRGLPLRPAQASLLIDRRAAMADAVPYPPAAADRPGGPAPCGGVRGGRGQPDCRPILIVATSPTTGWSSVMWLLGSLSSPMVGTCGKSAAPACRCSMWRSASSSRVATCGGSFLRKSQLSRRPPAPSAPPRWPGPRGWCARPAAGSHPGGRR